MIKPTVGRVVLFHPPLDPGYPVCEGEPLPATISKVWSDTCVNIGFLDANGNPHNQTSAFLYQGDGALPGGSFCEWMPFQKGQATAQTPDLDNLFTYHAPFGNQTDRYRLIRDTARAFAEQLVFSVPDCDERRKALGFVRAAVMWANAGIACNEKPPQ